MAVLICALGIYNISGWKRLLDLCKDRVETSKASFCLWPERGGKKRWQQDSVYCLVFQGEQVLLACDKLPCFPNTHSSFRSCFCFAQQLLTFFFLINSYFFLFNQSLAQKLAKESVPFQFKVTQRVSDRVHPGPHGSKVFDCLIPL